MPCVKTSVRTTRSGTVRYLQLAHNEWDQETQRSRTRVLYNFGREDEIDKDQVRCLVAALSRLLDPAEALAASGPGELSVSASRPAGGTHALDRLWRKLGLDEVILRCLAGRPDAGRKADPGTERVLFALAANRALAASSKLAAAEWVCRDVHIDGLDETSDDACYRAMDQLLSWLALLLTRVAENTAGQTRARIRAELQRQHAVTWTGPAGTFRQATGLTKPLRDIYTALSIEPPKKILALDPAPATP